MKIEDKSLQQLDLEYITNVAILWRMKNMNSVNMHDFLTSFEGLISAYSTKFLQKMKKEFERGVKYSGINKREFQDTVDAIDKELERRNHE